MDPTEDRTLKPRFYVVDTSLHQMRNKLNEAAAAGYYDIVATQPSRTEMREGGDNHEAEITTTYEFMVILRWPAGVCRGCGCTDQAACFAGCYWVQPDVCSQCALVRGAVDQATGSG